MRTLQITFVSACLFICVCLAGCSKNNTPGQTSVSTLRINYFGNTIPGGTINFSSTAPAGSKCLWTFGDGSATSTEASPTHTYNDLGDYTVTLLLNNDPGLKLTQRVTILPDPVYTSLLGGTRTWHHKLVPQFSMDTTVLNDTSFAITCMNQVAIKIGRDTLTWYSTNNGRLFYRNTNSSVTSFENTLAFDHIANSISYSKYFSSGGNPEVEVFQYP